MKTRLSSENSFCGGGADGLDELGGGGAPSELIGLRKSFVIAQGGVQNDGIGKLDFLTFGWGEATAPEADDI